MINQSEKEKRGVVCLHCGMPTPLPDSGMHRHSSTTCSGIALIRCVRCGKEAPYVAADVVTLPNMPAFLPCAA